MKQKHKISSWGRIENHIGFRYFPSPNSSGRSYLSIRKIGPRPVYHFVMALFNDPEMKEWKPGMTVDHILSYEPWNDHCRNLRWATKREQSLNRGIIKGNAGDLPVEGRKLNTASWKSFSSMSNAETELDLSTGSVSRCCSGDYRSWKGWEFRRADDSDLEEEEWMSFKGSYWSSLGRVKMSASDRKRFPSVGKDGRCHLKVDGVFKSVGEMILCGFGIEKPSDSHTVHHKDYDPTNNQLSNLCWYDFSSQIKDRPASKERQGFQIETRRVGDVEWTWHPNSKSAAEALKCSQSDLLAVAAKRSRQRTFAGLNGSRFESRIFESEDQKDIPGEEWKTIDEVDWVEGGQYNMIGRG